MPRLTGRRRGYTLIEILIVLVILGVVGSAILGLLDRQRGFYRGVNETAGVRRELRGGASLLPMEARSISTVGGDVQAMDATSFEFRATIGSGVACALGAQSVVLPPVDLAHHTLTAIYSPPAAGDQIFVFDEGTDPGAKDDAWRQYTVSSVSTTNAQCGGAPFTDPVADAGKPRIALAVTAGIASTIQVGAVVRILRPVRYSLYEAASGRWYLGFEEQQGGAWSTVEPVSGPYVASTGGAGSGLQFAYFDTLGVSTTDASRLGRVDVALRGSGDMSGQSDSLLFRIGIRNVR